MEKYIIKNGRVIDPAAKRDGIFDIMISNGIIEHIGEGLSAKDAQVIDAKGSIVAPGLIDLHVHLREPGREDEESVLSGTRAAAKGGFSTVLCMPNTEPAIDSPETIKILKSIIDQDAHVSVLISGAITKGRLGKDIVDLHSLKSAGAVAISDDGSSVEDETLMEEAFKYAAKEKVLVITHSEDHKISGKGVINAGFVATKMGLRGIPHKAEYERIDRDIKLAEASKAAVHIAHVSCKESVDIIRKAKKRGANVTAETAPHYFTLTDECCVTYDTNTKMNPPLRAKEDVEAIKRGLADGTIDCIATDHAPHTDSEKDVEFEFAPFGITGLETALALSIMALVDTKALSWSDLIARMSTNPARIIGIDRGALKEGLSADIVIINPDKEWTYEKDKTESRSKNSPFINWKLKGRATHLFVGGKLRMKEGSITKKG